ncbi:MAG: hypothetical protein WKF94_19905 [Solirubrobacteraceae bacterium]
MPADPPDGLTDELADEISAELELGPEDDTRALAAVRPGDDEHVELVLYDEDGEQPDVAVELTCPQARALAAALLATAEAASAEA